jgi:hypothetical protein
VLGFELIVEGVEHRAEIKSWDIWIIRCELRGVSCGFRG